MDERFDAVVLGSGLSGLSYALEVANYGSVAVVTKRAPEESNTHYAQGGIAAVVTDEDSFDDHIENTMVAGDGLNNRAIVTLCVKEGPEAIRRLQAYGIEFEASLGREGGHTQRRVLHAGDITGQAIQEALIEQARNHPNITLFSHHSGLDLIRRQKLVQDGQPNRILGAYVLDESTGNVRTFGANVVTLATGGAGKVYLYTSNPDVATGDGVAMAWRARAKVANMEFFQFHPTCLYHPSAKSFLISEALRGEGGILRRMDGEPFMDRIHPLGSLAPRDVVARAIDVELKRTGDDSVLLDLTDLDPTFLEERFPTILGRCGELGIDFRTTPIPVVPAAHYQCGGVVTDQDGRTSVPGLYAVGEVACTGLHGANRLASNSLLECAVMAHRAALASEDAMKSRPEAIDLPVWSPGYAEPGDEAVVISHSWDEIRRTMWNYVGIVRSNKRLQRARRRLSLLISEIHEDWWRFHVTRDSIELRNIACVADLIVEGALRRQESRGLHYNLDFPHKDDEEWRRDTVLWRGSE
jgi:L-aspartate oxidase